MPVVLADGAVPEDWVAKNQIPKMDKKMRSETRPALRLRDVMKKNKEGLRLKPGKGHGTGFAGP
jgi:hypothetical protein